MKKKEIKLTKEEISKAVQESSLREAAETAGAAEERAQQESPLSEEANPETVREISLWDEVDGIAPPQENLPETGKTPVIPDADPKPEIVPVTITSSPLETENNPEEDNPASKKARKKSKRRKEEKPPKRKMTKEQLKKYYKLMFLSDLKVMPFLLPSLIGVIMFYLAPFGVAIFYAFVDNPITKNFVGFQNIVSVFKNGSFRLGAMNTLKFSVMAVPLAVIISLLLALMLNHKIPFASQFRTSFLSPLVVPVASVVLVFQVLFNYNGVANLVVTFFGGDKIDWLKSVYAPYVVLLLFLWKNLGYNMILFLGALGNIPQDALEVAYLDTNNEWKIFWLIKIRYLSPTLLFATIISLINSFKVFREVYLLTGSYPFDSIYILQNYMNNMFDSMDYQKLSSAAIIMAIVMVVIIGGMYVAENRFGRDMEE